jgi:hypothetical protein
MSSYLRATLEGDIFRVGIVLVMVLPFEEFSLLINQQLLSLLTFIPWMQV